MTEVEGMRREIVGYITDCLGIGGEGQAEEMLGIFVVAVRKERDREWMRAPLGNIWTVGKGLDILDTFKKLNALMGYIPDGKGDWKKIERDSSSR